VSGELKRALGLLLEGKSRVKVELEETLIEDLPEEPDWDLHASARAVAYSLSFSLTF